MAGVKCVANKVAKNLAILFVVACNNTFQSALMSLGRAKRHLFQGTPPFSYDTSAGGTVQTDLTRKSGPLWPNWPTVANLVHCSHINPL